MIVYQKLGLWRNWSRFNTKISLVNRMVCHKNKKKNQHKISYWNDCCQTVLRLRSEFVANPHEMKKEKLMLSFTKTECFERVTNAFSHFDNQFNFSFFFRLFLHILCIHRCLHSNNFVHLHFFLPFYLVHLYSLFVFHSRSQCAIQIQLIHQSKIRESYFKIDTNPFDTCKHWDANAYTTDLKNEKKTTKNKRNLHHFTYMLIFFFFLYFIGKKDNRNTERPPSNQLDVCASAHVSPAVCEYARARVCVCGCDDTIFNDYIARGANLIDNIIY